MRGKKNTTPNAIAPEIVRAIYSKAQSDALNPATSPILKELLRNAFNAGSNYEAWLLRKSADVSIFTKTLPDDAWPDTVEAAFEAHIKSRYERK